MYSGHVDGGLLVGVFCYGGTPLVHVFLLLIYRIRCTYLLNLSHYLKLTASFAWRSLWKGIVIDYLGDSGYPETITFSCAKCLYH